MEVLPLVHSVAVSRLGWGSLQPPGLPDKEFTDQQTCLYFPQFTPVSFYYGPSREQALALSSLLKHHHKQLFTHRKETRSHTGGKLQFSSILAIFYHLK